MEDTNNCTNNNNNNNNNQSENTTNSNIGDTQQPVGDDNRTEERLLYYMHPNFASQRGNNSLQTSISPHGPITAKINYKSVPAQIKSPSGKMYFGMLKSDNDQNFPDETEEEEDIEYGPFVFYKRPLSTRIGKKNMKKLKLIFYVLALIDVAILTFLYYDVFKALTVISLGKADDGTDTPSILYPILFVCCVLLNIFGCLAVRSNKIRLITLFVLLISIEFIITLLWISSLEEIIRTFSILFVIILADRIRSKLMYSWFSASG